MATGRGQLSSLELLPREANPIVAWAAGELANRERTQTDIYAEFVTRCETLMKEHRGELEFRIPAFASFNRYSMRQARMSRRLDQTRDIVKVLSQKHDAQTADEVTIIAAEMIKAAVLYATGDGEDVMDGKELKALAEALRAAQAAQNLSSTRKTKETEQLQARLGEAVDAVTGGLGSAKEHREVQKSIARADAKALAAILNRDLIIPWMQLNFGPLKVYPRLVIDEPDQEDLSAFATAIGGLIDRGLEVDQGEVLDKFGLKQPQTGAKLMRPANATASAP